MKKMIAFIVAVCFILACAIAAGPFWVLHHIKKGIEQGNAAEFSTYFDYPVLRSNLKAQLKTAMSEKLAKEMRDNPFAALASGLAAQIGDGLVDTLVEFTVTPDGLQQLMETKALADKKMPENISSASNSSTQTATQTASMPKAAGSNSDHDQHETLKTVRWAFDSQNQFSVWLLTGKGDDVRFVLTRSTGFSWQLSNIILPPGNNLFSR